jgi:serine/threonine protein kinase
LLKAVGHGQFGEVYLAKMKDATGKDIDCAVKMLKDVKSQADRDEFVHEAEVMLETEHTNVMGMLGVAVQQRPWLMVLDFMAFGDMQAMVKSAPPKGITLTDQEFFVLCSQTCNGMKYLESIGFAHCDLAARNVLVAADNNCKVADFGLTRRLRQRPSWTGPKMMKIPIRTPFFLSFWGCLCVSISRS